MSSTTIGDAPGGDVAHVVVYLSAITDVRQVEEMLRQAGLPFELVVLSMRGGGERRRFRDLREETGHATLPQIFVGDAFIGGEPELRRYLDDRGLRTRAADAYVPGARPAPAADGTDPPPGATRRDTSTPSTDAVDTATNDDAATTDGTATGAPPPAAAQAPAAGIADRSADAQPPGTRGEDAGGTEETPAGTSPGPWSWLLGFAGLIPFAAATVMIAAGWHGGLALEALLAYGAVILSFVGAVHWGYALREGRHRTRALITSVLPSLVAWVSLLPADAVLGLSVQIAGFALWHAWERLAAFLPGRYMALRLRLTVLVVLLEAGALAAIVTG